MDIRVLNQQVPFLPPALLPPEGCSSSPIVLDKTERSFAITLYWLRNLRKGREWCIQNRINPGPFGYISRKGLWYPKPCETCENPMEHKYIHTTRKDGNDSGYLSPWSVREHCISWEHVCYLVKNKLWAIYKSDFSDIYHRVRSLTFKTIEDMPLFINHEDEIVRLFAVSALAGKVKW